MAPSRKWIGFFAAELLLSSISSSRCFSLDFDLTTDEAMLLMLFDSGEAIKQFVIDLGVLRAFVVVIL